MREYSLLLPLVLAGCQDQGLKVYNTPPEVTLTYPAMDQVLAQGSSVEFAALVHDEQDPNEDLVYTWTSSLQGSLSGAQTTTDNDVAFIFNGLQVGEHTVRLQVTDSDGETGEDVVAFVVDTGSQVDADEDGYVASSEGGDDCDDDDPHINPDAEEVCDGRDNDCDGSVDEGLETSSWYPDDDGDGYGAEAGVLDSCDQPSGYVEENTDCQDTEATIHPGAEDVCDDGIDSDCDGEEEVGTRVSGTIDLASSDAKLIGEAAGDSTPLSLASSDLNGDGHADAVIGSSGPDGAGENSGAAYVVLGPIVGDLDLSAADAEITGEGVGDHAGTDVAAGDFDGDGSFDLVVGASEEDEGGTDAGAVYFVGSPSSGPISLTSAFAKVTGEAGGDHAGQYLAIGDFDGNSVDDLIVGAPANDSNGAYSGEACIQLGPVSGTHSLADADACIRGERAESYAGARLATGDFDGDGSVDIAVTAWQDSAFNGVVYLERGFTSGISVLSDLDASWTGEAASDWAGTSLATGDWDGDGLDDVMIGAPYNDAAGRTGAGAAYVVPGSSSGAASLSTASVILLGENEADAAGRSVVMADFDADGSTDLVVGAWSYDRNAGAAYVLYGPVSGVFDLSGADVKFEGEPNSQAGYALAAGNIDGEGGDDLLIGAPSDDDGGSGAGAVYLILGGGCP